MANKKHLAILKQGVDAWNVWRKENPRVRPDLNEARLSEAYLNEADLSGVTLYAADLRMAALSGARLTRAILRRANFTRADLRRAVLSDADLNGADLRMADLRRADFRRATLTNAYLGEANLSEADLCSADLTRTALVDARLNGAKLRGAGISEANFTGADLSEADLSGAVAKFVDLTEANLTGADLSGANLDWTILTEADLSMATLNMAHFRSADLSGARLFRTAFNDVDLSQVRGLDKVRHDGPSTIGIDTLYRSRGKIPEAFLRGCGVSEQLIEYARSLGAKPSDYSCCFISHSASDTDFCERLCADLQASHVRVWYFPEDAQSREPAWEEIDRSARAYDKLILVCSESSLHSESVNREIERASQRERQEDRKVLLPIRIERRAFATWQHHLKADVVAKAVIDFTGWDKDVAKYHKMFGRLLHALEK